MEDVSESALRLGKETFAGYGNTILGKITHTDVARFVDRTAVRFKFAHEHAEQGSLARTVGADEGDTVVCVYDGVDSVEENLLAEVVSDLIYGDHIEKRSGMQKAGLLKSANHADRHFHLHSCVSRHVRGMKQGHLRNAKKKPNSSRLSGFGIEMSLLSASRETTRCNFK